MIIRKYISALHLLCHELRFVLETPAAAQVDCVSNLSRPPQPRLSTVISHLNATIDSSQYGVNIGWLSKVNTCYLRVLKVIVVVENLSLK